MWKAATDDDAQKGATDDDARKAATDDDTQKVVSDNDTGKVVSNNDTGKVAPMTISKNDDIIYTHIMPILEAKWCTSPDSDFYRHIFNLFSCLIIYNMQFLYMSRKAVIQYIWC